jgi:predicted XRE-type DNA-binding protein
MNISREDLQKLIIVKDSGCWHWNGTIHLPHYCHVIVDGEKCNARRVVRQVFGPPFNENLALLKTCKNNYCVAPAHHLTGDERFLKNYAVSETGCHEWKGGITVNGYGVTGNGGGCKRAHRRMWELKVGQIPQGMVIRHLCHNRKCVNIDHLAVGTHQDNMDDMVKAGRACNGWKNGNYKKSYLDEKDILEIRQLASEDEFTLWEIAEAYGADVSYISDIAKGDCWPQVGGPRTKREDDPVFKYITKGSEKFNAKITESDAVRIRELCDEGVLTQGQIGDQFGIDQTEVSDIAHGIIWKHVGGPIVEGHYLPTNREYDVGEDHHAAKITEIDVKEIRRLYATKEMNQQQLAERYGLKQCHVSDIVLSVSWSHVPAEHEIKKKTTGVNSQGKACKLTENDVIQMRDCYRNGASFSEIAKMFKISPDAARSTIIGLRWSHVPGAIPDAGRNITEKDAIKIKAMLRDGEKPRSIAKELGVKPGVVYKISSGQSWSHVS